MLRLFIAVSIPAGVLLAQEASPAPVPEASPAPVPETSPAPSPAAAPAASPELSEPAAVSPPVQESDVIPMEEGAPVETRDIAPSEAMPEDALIQPDALIPDERPSVPPAVPPSFESAQEKARQLSIRYREVRVQVEKDPKVMSLFEQAEKAKTFEDQRAAFREYYRLLFKKIATVDKSLADKCKVMETAYLRRLAQERLEPTIPLNPPPTPEPLN